MEKGRTHLDLMLIANHQTTQVAQPGKGAFDLPTLAIAAQAAPVVEGRLAAALAVRSNQEDSALQPAPARFVAVVAPFGNHPQWALLRPAQSTTWHRDLGQRSLRHGLRLQRMSDRRQHEGGRRFRAQEDRQSRA